ncbi:MAG: SUMF1/EgtB/PvdO family nonheme iron enzyme [Bacteroidota bacterium]
MKRLFLSALVLPVLAFTLINTKASAVPKKLKKDFAFVPSGLVVRSGDTLSVQAFYISKGEVTNKEYRLFLADLKANNKMSDYTKAYPDTLAWKQISPAFSDYYFSHPAYADYPVVNVSFEAAQMYCNWFTEKMNSDPKAKYVYQFRLPVREEFIRACRGENHGRQYAWKYEGVQNEKGNVLCNHLRNEPAIAGSLADNADITAPSRSYWPNDYGIYNLNGNVAEMTNTRGLATGGSWKDKAGHVRNESSGVYSGPQPNVGFRMVSTFLQR